MAVQCYTPKIPSGWGIQMAERVGKLEPAPITRLLEEWSAGSDTALRELLPLVYERMRYMARSLMRRNSREQTIQPTALVGELYVRLASTLPPSLTSRDHFFSLCARTMRWILADHARNRVAEKRRIEIHLSAPPDVPWLGSRDSDALDLDRALDKLAAINARAAKILELRVYLGCTAAETASILSISKPTVDRSLTMARAWLCRELRPPASGSKDVHS
jgi:RNA polymerase sigma factor (TIGR02999 family)